MKGFGTMLGPVPSHDSDWTPLFSFGQRDVSFIEFDVIHLNLRHLLVSEGPGRCWNPPLYSNRCTR